MTARLLSLLQNMDKKQAAAFLGCSPRQLERYVSANKIGVTMEPGRTRPTPVFDEGELQRFKESLERPVHRPAVERMNSTQQMPTQNDGALSLLSHPSQLEAFAAIFQAMQPQQGKAAPTAQEMAAKLMLTVDEAVIYSGLSKSAIDTAIRENSLKAHRGKWRGRRIKRADLESYIKKL